MQRPLRRAVAQGQLELEAVAVPAGTSHASISCKTRRAELAALRKRGQRARPADPRRRRAAKHDPYLLGTARRPRTTSDRVMLCSGSKGRAAAACAQDTLEQHQLAGPGHQSRASGGAAQRPALLLPRLGGLHVKQAVVEHVRCASNRKLRSRADGAERAEVAHAARLARAAHRAVVLQAAPPRPPPGRTGWSRARDRSAAAPRRAAGQLSSRRPAQQAGTGTGARPGRAGQGRAAEETPELPTPCPPGGARRRARGPARASRCRPAGRAPS
jgi:hypothetical protein